MTGSGRELPGTKCSEPPEVGKNRERPGICSEIEQIDTTERLSPDDQATLREQQFLDAALRRQRAAVAADAAWRQPGRCGNCSSKCLPQAVYCDDDCRADHEARLRVQQRQGVVR